MDPNSKTHFIKRKPIFNDVTSDNKWVLFFSLSIADALIDKQTNIDTESNIDSDFSDLVLTWAIDIHQQLKIGDCMVHVSINMHIFHTHINKIVSQHIVFYFPNSDPRTNNWMDQDYLLKPINSEG